MNLLYWLKQNYTGINRIDFGPMLSSNIFILPLLDLFSAPCIWAVYYQGPRVKDGSFPRLIASVARWRNLGRKGYSPLASKGNVPLSVYQTYRGRKYTLRSVSVRICVTDTQACTRAALTLPHWNSFCRCASLVPFISRFTPIFSLLLFSGLSAGFSLLEKLIRLFFGLAFPHRSILFCCFYRWRVQKLFNSRKVLFSAQPLSQCLFILFRILKRVAFSLSTCLPNHFC